MDSGTLNHVFPVIQIPAVSVLSIPQVRELHQLEADLRDAENLERSVLETKDRKARELAALRDDPAYLELVARDRWDRELGLGCVNPRTDEAEDPATIVARAEEALRYWRPEQIWLNPDCGFGCFANRCVNEEEVAVQKICRITEAAAVLRDKYG